MTGLFSRIALALALSAIPIFAAGCGTTSSSLPPAPATGSLGIGISDASTEDWAMIGVKVESIALTRTVGGARTVYTAASPAPTVNLVQLDQLAELLGTGTVPSGSYTGAVLTISANPGDLLLTAAADPTAGFEGTA